MKKIITLFILLVMIISLASCDYLPDDIKATIDGAIDGVTGIFGGSDHEHEFVEFESKKAFCTKDGYIKSKCSCGEIKEEVIPKLGHDVQYQSTTAPTCIKDGVIKNLCTRCSYDENEVIPKLGHEWGDFVEYSRLITCTRNNCTGVKLEVGEGKYAEILVFNFGDAEKAALDAAHDELAGILSAADKYDPALHALDENRSLEADYKVVEALYEAYSDLILEAQGQYSIAMTLYYCDHNNKTLETIYNDMQTYYTDLVAKFYSLSKPWHDSKYRDYFFEGATEDEIKAFLADSEAYSDPDYIALKNANDKIELDFNGLANPETSPVVPELYYQFVQNNMAIAELLGYDNYVEYAYENVYGREYSYQDIAQFVEYVKEYIVPIYNGIYDDWASLTGGSLTEADLELYYSLGQDSFFADYLGNKLFNDYIDNMNMAFVSNPDKQMSFSDALNALMSDGNMFQGTYQGAYVTFIRGADIPIAYFGNGYNAAFTVAHEFGHYMNELYNGKDYSQSFDLLETHSQGQEMLFLQYVKSLGIYEGKNYDIAETYQLLNAFYTIVLATQVDCFEQAVYLNYYDGPGSEAIMADGKITADEYDALFAGISEYLGIDEDYRVDEYWRYVTISSPCYYISYAISGVTSMQIYAEVARQGFDATKDAYLKLFTYTDVDPEMTVEEILDYAGLYHFTEEELYANLRLYLGKR